jgi:hypothetical protein
VAPTARRGAGSDTDRPPGRQGRGGTGRPQGWSQEALQRAGTPEATGNRPSPSRPATGPDLVNLNPNGDNWLALRSEPGGVRIMKMGPDTLFTVVGEQGEWAHLRLSTGETGWAAKAYIGCCVTAPGDRL